MRQKKEQTRNMAWVKTTDVGEAPLKIWPVRLTTDTAYGDAPNLAWLVDERGSESRISRCPQPESPYPFLLRPGTPEHAHLRPRTGQLVAGVMDPDLNLPELNP